MNSFIFHPGLFIKRLKIFKIRQEYEYVEATVIQMNKCSNEQLQLVSDVLMKKKDVNYYKKEWTEIPKIRQIFKQPTKYMKIHWEEDAIHY